MAEKVSDEEASAIAAQRLRLAREWRDQWRRELAAPSEGSVTTPLARAGDFATALTRAEFGRHYFDASRYCQKIERGEVVWAVRRPPRKRR